MKNFIVGISIIILNLIDGIVTYCIINDSDQELNPLVRFCMERLGVWFLTPKFILGSLVGLLVCVFWNRFKVARIGGVIALLVYFLVIIYHIVGIIIIYTS